MPEAIRVLRGELRLVRTDELLADERNQTLGLRLPVGERLDRSAVEQLPFDRTALEHRTLVRVQLVEPSGKQCLDRRRHFDAPVGAGAHEREHLFQEERIAVRSGSDPRPELVVYTAER